MRKMDIGGGSAHLECVSIAWVARRDVADDDRFILAATTLPTATLILGVSAAIVTQARSQIIVVQQMGFGS